VPIDPEIAKKKNNHVVKITIKPSHSDGLLKLKNPAVKLSQKQKRKYRKNL